MARLPALIGPLVAALAAVSSAFAHAQPAKVNPGDGAVLDQAPTVVEITMTQELARQPDANDIDVFDENGKEVSLVSAVIDNGDRRKLSVALPSNLKVGTYTVRWKTLSAEDGDPADGTLSFTYDPNQPINLGRTDLRADTAVQPGASSPPNAEIPSAFSGGGGGTSWILVAAVAVGMFVVGGGTTYFLVQKRT